METLNNEQNAVSMDGKDGLTNEENGQNNVRDANGKQDSKALIKLGVFLLGVSAAGAFIASMATHLDDFISRKIRDARNRRNMKKIAKKELEEDEQ